MSAASDPFATSAMLVEAIFHTYGPQIARGVIFIEIIILVRTWLGFSPARAPSGRRG